MSLLFPLCVSAFKLFFNNIYFFSFAGEKLEGTLVFAHYDEGAINPTFYYLADALVEEKV